MIGEKEIISENNYSPDINNFNKLK